MAAQFQVNITIAAGADFTQEYTVTSPDRLPVDITGYKFSANLAKHPTAIDAAVSTSGSPVYKYIPFVTNIVNGEDGLYSLTMLANETSKLQEGKYVYNVVMTDGNGDTQSMMSGLAFVDVAFGSVS